MSSGSVMMASTREEYIALMKWPQTIFSSHSGHRCLEDIAFAGRPWTSHKPAIDPCTWASRRRRPGPRPPASSSRLHFEAVSTSWLGLRSTCCRSAGRNAACSRDPMRLRPRAGASRAVAVATPRPAIACHAAVDVTTCLFGPPAVESLATSSSPWPRRVSNTLRYWRTGKTGTARAGNLPKAAKRY